MSDANTISVSDVAQPATRSAQSIAEQRQSALFAKKWTTNANLTDSTLLTLGPTIDSGIRRPLTFN
jgi:hypothetical protein